MGRSKVGKLPGFCLNRVATRVLVRSPPSDSKPKAAVPAAGETEELNPKPVRSSSDSKEYGACKGAVVDDVFVQARAEGVDDGATVAKDVDDRSAAAVSSTTTTAAAKKVEGTGRLVLVVVDSSIASRGALLWALSHAVQVQDTLVLLAVTAATRHGIGESRSRDVDARNHPVLCSATSLCQAKKPGVQLELSLVEGREKGPAIVEEARRRDASLLVLGHKRRSVTWRLLLMWAGNRGGVGGQRGGVVDYCIQNAACMTVAVRRRSKSRGGGYLITTRRHKDFWLLA